MALSRKFPLLALALSTAMLGACQTKHNTIIPGPTTEVDAPLEPGEFGLLKLDPKDYPDMRAAFRDRANLERAVDKSLQYLKAPSSRKAYPSGPQDPITHDQVMATLIDFKKMLHTTMSPDQFQQELLTRYDVWTSKGFDRKGSVWFTGYYTPIFYGSPTENAVYKYPLYTTPDDLVVNHQTGEILGEKMADGSVRPYPTRKEIAEGNLLKGKEIFWFRTELEPYIIQVQGSAKIITPTGQAVYLGYAGKNGRDYRGLGAELVKDGKIEKKKLSLPAVVQYFGEHPGEEHEYIMRNDSFEFVKPYAGEWPAGSLGVQVTPHRSLATDKKIFPRASLTFIQADMPDSTGENLSPYSEFVLDQDTGGAIRAAGRADIYMGIGEEAGKLAGREFSQGRLYYIFLRPGQYQESPTYSNLARPSGKVGPAETDNEAIPGGPPAVTGGNEKEMFPGAKKKRQ